MSVGGLSQRRSRIKRRWIERGALPVRVRVERRDGRQQRPRVRMARVLEQVFAGADLDNLAREGISADRVQFVGNLVMDTIRAMLDGTEPVPPRIAEQVAVLKLLATN